MQQDIPLHDIEREQSLLGALLLNNSHFDYVAGKLSPDHFYEPLHSHIFAEIERRIGLGEPATPLSIKGCLSPDRTIGGLSVVQYLGRLAAHATTGSNVPYWAEAIIQYKAAREHIFASRDLNDSVHKGVPIDEALKIYHDTAETIRTGYLGPGLRDTSASMAETMAVTVERMTCALQGQATALGIPTGLKAFDEATGGLQRGELVVVAGRPGMGKTSLAVSMARQIAQQRDKTTGKFRFGVGFFSLEMSKSSIGMHFVTDQGYERSPIAYTDIWRGLIDLDTAEFIAAETAREVSALPLELDYSTSLSVYELAAKARRMAGKLERVHGVPLGVIFIDYLKFVRASDRYAGQRVIEIGEITAALKGLARQMDCCIVLLHQLNREVEKTASKRPSMEHLRESGDVEQDADVIALLHREAYYIERSGDLRSLDGDAVARAKAAMDRCEFELDIILAKQRMGPAADITVYCDIKSSTVRSPGPRGST